MGDRPGVEVAPDRLIGERIAERFVVERLIGHGQLSTAFRAYDDRLHRRVTVKLFHPRHRDDVQVVEAQIAAARSVARLSHEHIAMVIDRGEHEGMPLVVLEHVRGENLQERIERYAPLAVGEVVGYGLQLARALAYAHGHDVLHGNLRPGNVLLTEEREVKLVDFGGGSYVAQLVGDPFAAPELRELDAGAPPAVSDDVYALGALLFVALTERGPVPGLEPGELQLLRPDVSPQLAGIVARTLAADPGDRHESMRELAAELASVREAAPPAGRRGAAGSREQRDDQATQPFAVHDGDAHTEEAAGDTDPGLRALGLDGATTARARARAEAERARSGSGGRGPAAQRRRPRRERTAHETRSRLLAWSMVLVPIAALVIVGVMIAGERGTEQVKRPAKGVAGPVVPLEVTDVVSFDPEPGDGSEHPELVANVTDGDLETSWATDGYDTADFNRAKPGVGLVLRLAGPSDVKDVAVRTTLPGWTVQIRAADTPQPELDDWRVVSKSVPVEDKVRIPVDLDGKPTTYLLVWITRLVIDTEDTNRSRARLSEVVVYGTSASEGGATSTDAKTDTDTDTGAGK